MRLVSPRGEGGSMLGAYTLGAEKELQVVDAAAQKLSGHDYSASAKCFPDGSVELGCEIDRCALKVKAPICLEGPSLARHLARLRCIMLGLDPSGSAWPMTGIARLSRSRMANVRGMDGSLCTGVTVLYLEGAEDWEAA